MVLVLAIASLASLSALSFLAPSGANLGILCGSLAANTNDYVTMIATNNVSVLVAVHVNDSANTPSRTCPNNWSFETYLEPPNASYSVFSTFFGSNCTSMTELVI